MTRIKIVGALVAAYLVAGYAARWVLWRTEPCDQPCRYDRTTAYGDCQPLRLILDAKARRTSRSNEYELWYRAELQNRSCEGFALPQQFFTAGTYFDSKNKKELPTVHRGPLVYDSAERLVERIDSDSQQLSDIHEADKTIYPYENDESALRPHFAREWALGGWINYYLLEAGRTATVAPTIFAPHFIALKEYRDSSGAGTQLMHVPAPDNASSTNYSEGYRLLGKYKFGPRSEYTAEIDAVFNPVITPAFRHRRYPAWATGLLHFVAYHSFAREVTLPDVEVHAKSERIRIAR